MPTVAAQHALALTLGLGPLRRALTLFARAAGSQASSSEEILLQEERVEERWSGQWLLSVGLDSARPSNSKAEAADGQDQFGIAISW